MSLDEKKILKEELNKALARFKLTPQQKQLTLYPLSPWPNRLFSRQAIRYQKKIIPITKGSSLAFVHKNKDKEGFLWYTNAKCAKRAVLYGLIKPDALTAATISTLGQYLGSVLKRAHQRHTISDLCEKKLTLLRLTQQLITKLEPLERLINTAFSSPPTQSDVVRLTEALDNYAKELSAFHQEHAKYLKGECQIPLKEALHNKQKNINAFLSEIKDAQQHNKSLDHFFSANGKQSLGLFIKHDLLASLHALQCANQLLSFSKTNKAFNRGDLHSATVDALKVIQDHKPDLQNPILKEHQGYFDGDTTLTFDFTGDHYQKRLLAHQLMLISHIEKRDQLVFKDSSPVIRENARKKEFKLKETPYVKWSHNFGFGFTLLRSLLFVWNTALGLIFGLSIDLFIGMGAGVFGFRFPSLSQKLRVNFSSNMENVSFYSRLCQELHTQQYSLGTIVGVKIGNFFRNVFVDFFFGVHASVSQYKIELWDNLISDYQLGHKKETSLKENMERYFAEVLALKQEHNFLIRQTLQEKYPDREHCALSENNKTTAKFARAPYELNDGECLDVLNALARGTKLVCDTFSHALFNQNPLTGLIFSHVYALGALAVFAPEKVSFLPKAYIQLSQAIAETMSHGRLTSSLASASFQAQISAGITEAFKNGQDSWLTNAALTFEKEPSDILVYATLAVGLGAILAYEIEVPILSEEIRNNMGSFPLPSLGVAGGKIGVLLFDFLEAKKTPVKSNNLEHLRTLLNGLTLSEKTKLYEVTLLLSFCEHKELLPYLPFNSKRFLIHAFRKEANLKDDELETIKSLLFPNDDHSIFFVTVTTALNYIPLMLRCLLSAITQTLDPWHDLKIKLKKDLTRFVRALNSLTHTATTNLKSLALSMYDLFANEGVARTHTALTNEHTISKQLHNFHSSIDEQFSQTEADLTHYTTPLYKDTTAPTPFKLLNVLLHAKAKEELKPQVLTQEVNFAIKR